MNEAPVEHRLRVNGVELAWFEWRRELSGEQPTILLAHATGFHARVWDETIRQLGARHVIALDQRGHGRSEKAEITHWDIFGKDLSAFVDALDLEDVVGVGHSMGGHAMVDAAAARLARFRRLVLIDPVIAARDAYGGGGWTIAGKGGAMHPTVKRRRHFASPEEMIDRFRDRVPYRVFTPAALRDYCVYGLLPEADGEGFALACPPEVEASIYMTSRTNAAVHDSIARLGALPTLIVRARLPPPDRGAMDFSSSPTWTGLVGEFANARDVHLAEHTHFLPMEIPDRVAELILKEAEADAD